MKNVTGKRAGVVILCAVTFLMVLAAWFLLPPVGQPQGYHYFLDDRTFLNIPNLLNVVSNAGFLAVGIVGLILLRSGRGAGKRPFFVSPGERLPYVVLFTGLCLTAFGSSWYHLAPSNATLLWDRLPMTIIFASFLSITVMERIDVKAGLIFLPPLVLAGATTAVYWYVTEAAGKGDLRPYIFMQFYPMLGIPLMMALFPPRYTKAAYLFLVIGLYGCAKLLEVCDAQIYDCLGFVSGHTLKHFAAALACVPVIVMLRDRRPAGPGD